MTAADRPAVRVVCVTYHPGPELADFARSLRGATDSPTHLVLVDNGSDRRVVDEVATTYGAQVRDPGGNLGYGRAANVGAAEGDEPWLVIANPDIVWHTGALDRLLEVATADPTVGAAGPALLNVDGTRYPSARALPSLTQGVGHAVLGRVWPTNPWTIAYQRRQEDTSLEQRAAGWLSGACLLVRRTAFEQVGGFDEAYFMFFEDLDLGERLSRAGWTNVYVPSAVVTHVGGTSWRERPAPMIRAHHASAYLYLSRRYDGWYLWPVRAAIRVGLVVRQTLELRRAR
ncbi:glycosyltransferase family 2 protein [Actinotalea sp. K2]|uniref:glycosyltransferase family 2 protein n=1 Tax=Actinotalea sp. K2 TaxID=2939438 RepID=UPI002016F59E|nr:glycosyltransferase family 2 protein [Actinotalea sp. K2]MCL3862688.1 glycosyltransferase family 2 protein [Actinotalea sp. K2]